MKIEEATIDRKQEIFALDQMVYNGPVRRPFLQQAIYSNECFVARQEQQIVGFGVMAQTFFDHYFISLLVVHPHFQRRGIGKSLMCQLMKVCPGEKLFTSTNQSNKAMHHLCQSLEFAKSGFH
ncbi:GNAT family N-acetyltransferase [Desmospora profundinema]|uniref:Ribosomal protein S18 acetylase RimI-like enzyme n=1 Tax=Desmospora profundinema TaxID=1571184 RepID=A0ABU1IK50_9BACL|nr:GNAT family N-acetyltransferase [Desmospora profundinema]MDR6225150.1 ribosomal protein S18 acetylase RimI-like enzyme [Desmospora profundinema]